MERSKRIYETTMIVNASLDDAHIDNIVEKVKDVVIKHGGEILDENKWGRKRFAYPIKKKNNGFYVVLEYRGPGEIVSKLERHFFLDENILRYLTVALDKRALKARSASTATAQPAPDRPAPPPPPKPEAPAPERRPAAAATADEGDEDDVT